MFIPSYPHSLSLFFEEGQHRWRDHQSLSSLLAWVRRCRDVKVLDRPSKLALVVEPFQTCQGSSRSIGAMPAIEKWIEVHSIHILWQSTASFGKDQQLFSGLNGIEDRRRLCLSNQMLCQSLDRFLPFLIQPSRHSSSWTDSPQSGEDLGQGLGPVVDGIWRLFCIPPQACSLSYRGSEKPWTITQSWLQSESLRMECIINICFSLNICHPESADCWNQLTWKLKKPKPFCTGKTTDIMYSVNLPDPEQNTCLPRNSVYQWMVELPSSHISVKDYCQHISPEIFNTTRICAA